MANVDIPGLFRILVVDDFEPWRQYVCSMLKTRPELCVVGEASDGLDAVQKTQELKPDLVLLDIGLPGLNGLEAMNPIRQSAPGVKIVFLTQDSDKDVVQTALNAGVEGYILKTDAQNELLSGIAVVLGAGKFVSRGVNESDTGETQEKS